MCFEQRKYFESWFGSGLLSIAENCVQACSLIMGGPTFSFKTFVRYELPLVGAEVDEEVGEDEREEEHTPRREVDADRDNEGKTNRD